MKESKYPGKEQKGKMLILQESQVQSFWLYPLSNLPVD